MWNGHKLGCSTNPLTSNEKFQPTPLHSSVMKSHWELLIIQELGITTLTDIALRFSVFLKETVFCFAKIFWRKLLQESIFVSQEEQFSKLVQTRRNVKDCFYQYYLKEFASSVFKICFSGKKIFQFNILSQNSSGPKFILDVIFCFFPKSAKQSKKIKQEMIGSNRRKMWWSQINFLKQKTVFKSAYPWMANTCNLTFWCKSFFDCQSNYFSY